MHECSAIAYYVTKVRAKKLFNVMKDIIRRPVEHSSRSVPQRTAEGTISSSNNMIELFSDLLFNRCRNSSIGRTLDCRAGGRGFDSRDRTNTLGLKVTEK